MGRCVDALGKKAALGGRPGTLLKAAVEPAYATLSCARASAGVAGLAGS